MLKALGKSVRVFMLILTTITLLSLLPPPVIFMLLGMLLGLAALGLVSVLYKDRFAHDPNRPKKLAWMVKVSQNRSVVINRGGRPTHVLRGDEGPASSSALFGLWMVYKIYVMKVTGYHVYFPFFTEPTIYDLPRYNVREEGGKKVFDVVNENSAGYRSNHVRTELTTWYFEYSGTEIQKIPFIVKGSVQIKITRGREIDALYMTDSWNVLLDQALNSVIRSVVRRDMTLDMVIGGINNDIWKTQTSTGDAYEQAANLIMERLKQYDIDGVKLEDIGIEIEHVDIIDFEDQLSPDEAKSLRAASIKKEEAKGLELTGRAEAANLERKGKAEAKVITIKGKAEAGAIRARGEADAEAQAKLVEAHKENPELATDIISADTLRAFAGKDGGIIDAIAAAYLKGVTKK